MYRLLGGHYSSVFAHTDSCANPSGSPLLQLLASFGESEQVATSPCCQRDLPDVISANPSSDVWSLTTAGHHRVRIPVSSSMSSAFPNRGVGRLTRVYPRTRFSAERFFEAADISLCSDLRVCSPPRSFLPLRVLPQGS